MNRTSQSIEKAILRGDIPPPQMTYGLDEDENPYKYMWSEDDIFAAWNYYRQVHKGRPRADGLITPQHLPNARELRAMIRQETILYSKTEDGNFVPTWRAEDI